MSGVVSRVPMAAGAARRRVDHLVTDPGSAAPWRGVRATGITPLGYAAFAFTLAVTAGVLIRRSVPAMAVTLAISAAVQIAVPHLVPPDRTVAAISMAAMPDVLAQPGSSGPTVVGVVARAVPGHPGAGPASVRQLPGRPRHTARDQLPARDQGAG